MTDPKRFRDEAPDSVEAELLNALCGEQPDPAARERVLRNIVIGVGIGATLVSAAKATAQAPLFASPGAWAALGVSAGAVVVIGVASISSLPAAPVAPDETKRTEHLLRVPSERARHAEPEPADEVCAACSRADPGASLPTVERRLPAPKAPSAPKARAARAPKQTLAEELLALSAAKRALDEGALDFALQRLDDYQSNFPLGYLREEAIWLRAQTLLKSGQLERAVRAARTLIAHSPRSPLADKARRLLDSVQNH